MHEIRNKIRNKHNKSDPIFYSTLIGCIILAILSKIFPEIRKKFPDWIQEEHHWFIQNFQKIKEKRNIVTPEWKMFSQLNMLYVSFFLIIQIIFTITANILNIFNAHEYFSYIITLFRLLSVSVFVLVFLFNKITVRSDSISSIGTKYCGVVHDLNNHLFPPVNSHRRNSFGDGIYHVVINDYITYCAHITFGTLTTLLIVLIILLIHNKNTIRINKWIIINTWIIIGVLLSIFFIFAKAVCILCPTSHTDKNSKLYQIELFEDVSKNEIWDCDYKLTQNISVAIWSLILLVTLIVLSVVYILNIKQIN